MYLQVSAMHMMTYLSYCCFLCLNSSGLTTFFVSIEKTRCIWIEVKDSINMNNVLLSEFTQFKLAAQLLTMICILFSAEMNTFNLFGIETLP